MLLGICEPEPGVFSQEFLLSLSTFSFDVAGLWDRIEFVDLHDYIQCSFFVGWGRPPPPPPPPPPLPAGCSLLVSNCDCVHGDFGLKV